MLPHEIGKDVILDPTIPRTKFYFGSVPEKLQVQENQPVEKHHIGKITKRDYLHKGEVRSQTYAVLFPGEKKDLWFLEKELT